MGDLISRAIGFGLRIYALVDRDPLLNVAPYGKCNTEADALDWLVKRTGATIERSCLHYQGLERCWFTYIPEDVAESSDTVPLVIHLHGAGGCATLPAVGWGKMAEEDGFVVVWPQGTNHVIPFVPDFFKNLPIFLQELLGFRLNCWNDGSQLFGAEPAGIDDLGFLQQMIPQILATDYKFTIDSNRIYMSGHSNGATMSQRFALQSPGVVAGVVAVSGAGQPNDPAWFPGGAAAANYTATPIVFVAGTIDGVVPFFERAGPLAGAIPSLDGWASINGCSAKEAVETEFKFLGYTQLSYFECSGSTQVMMLKLEDEGHHPFTRGEKPFEISPVNVIATCPFRGIPMFYEPDCQLSEVNSARAAWNFIKGFMLPDSRL